MATGKDVNIVESLKSKLDNIVNILNNLSCRTIKIKEFFVRFYYDVKFRIV